MDTAYRAALMWFRRDLRTRDNAALHHALKRCTRVHCVFVFDTAILDPLPRRDRRVDFIRGCLVELDANLRALAADAGVSHAADTGLITLHGLALDAIPQLAQTLGVDAVFANHDYEQQAVARDARIQRRLADAGIALHTFKDQVIFERSELLTQSGKPYSVFTPYKNAWLARVDAGDLAPFAVAAHATALAARPPPLSQPVPTLADLGFEEPEPDAVGAAPGSSAAAALLQDFTLRIDRYREARDYPAIKGPSYLSVHLRFGTISVREVARTAHALAQQGSSGAATWLSELIWRDFYFQVLVNFPHVSDEEGKSHSFRREYDAIAWEQGPQAEALFAAWCEGRTGYPLVDAAMLQLNRTGYMHNRLRMVTASFLCKDLGIDWRRGERYFADRLIDYDLSANNGGWQWAASTGCDAQPFFRIFNPVSQSERFDPHGRFIRRYLPPLERLADRQIHAPWKVPADAQTRLGCVIGRDYPAPVVDHDQARRRTLERYSVVKAG
jgi:deoxyribodipyrimidine photo-lyase